ncbi:30S ribosome-binding factor RbfA [uncultured Campylobacter sp.]|uniref:30S ribosome-binding factor RbfA n=1 Tax=uncultured Campylobacter sp. TaxID=218934 RepID=UPI00260BBC0F|nr:30S ribosome-binding factor RbfA [uncultured Campylobacter sp.]
MKNQAELRRLRTSSILKQLIPEALSTLDDPTLCGLCITDVECKRGRYDAFIYLDKMFFTKEEQDEVLRKLSKVKYYLQTYCMEAEGWFRSPIFHFKFDESLEHQNKMDELFSKAQKELERAKGEE